MLYPLSLADTAGTEGIGVTMAFSIDRSGATEALDPMCIDRAARRMVEKWRMLSGRFEWDKQRSMWALRIPTDDVLPASYATHTFTHTISSSPYTPPTPTSSCTRIDARPPISLFRHPSTPQDAASYHKLNAPLLNIHLTTLTRHPHLILLGISTPHSLADGTGMGMIAQALDAELSGRPWDPPQLPLEGSPNPLESAIEDALENVKDLAGREDSLALRRDYTPATLWTRARFISRLLWEYTWHRSEVKLITLGEDVVRKIVEPAKREAKAAGGGKFVSTGDVVVAWLLKSIYDASSSPNTLASCSVISTRPLLPTLGPYPHNALVLASLASVPIPSLPSTPLSSLALLHRASLTTARVPETLAEITRYGSLVPRRESGTDYWFFSNQVVAEITSFAALGPLVGYSTYTRITPKPASNARTSDSHHKLHRTPRVLDGADSMAFVPSQTRWFCPPHETSRLDDRTYVVTGGTGTGLGAHTALQLALRGATVLVGSRTESTALAHIAKVEAEYPDVRGRLKFFQMDFGTIKGAREAGERVLGMTQQLHGLVNNAGRLATQGPCTLSEDGIEMLAQVNHFGTFVFTETLLPLLIKTSQTPSADVRIVNVGSFAQQYLGDEFKWESFNSTLASSDAAKDGMKAKFARYGLSKLYNHLHISELQRHLDGKGAAITCISLSPGGVGTDNALDFSSVSPLLSRVVGPIMRLLTLTPSQGAYTSLFAVASPVVAESPETYKGACVVPFGKIASLSRLADDVELQKQVWDATVEVVQAGGIKA
ncbi:hypothetical protein RQP46_000138 [Phenoliferia psychrophenolica]